MLDRKLLPLDIVFSVYYNEIKLGFSNSGNNRLKHVAFKVDARYKKSSIIIGILFMNRNNFIVSTTYNKM